MSKTEEQRERFVALVMEHSRSMYRVARALLPGDADAQDAVGEAVLLAWQSFERLRRPEAARGWLLKITVNSPIPTSDGRAGWSIWSSPRGPLRRALERQRTCGRRCCACRRTSVWR